MLTRLRVKGFKNLVDVDVRFGPFTCVAGLNGVGKSNLFDAILFLRELADRPFVEAAGEVRGGADVRSLFTARGDDQMEFEAEMLIPQQGVDEFGQKAEASSTFVKYGVCLKLRRHEPEQLRDEIELLSESLSYVTKGDAPRSLGFRHEPGWRDSVVHADRRAEFISTDRNAGLVKLHQDRPRKEGTKKGGGRTWEFPLSALPRTVLSSARNAQESPTAVLARLAMRNWKLLQLEPSALRRPDEFRDPDHLETNGGNLPATLYRLAHARGDDPERVYAELSNRVADLIEGVRRIWVEKDDGRRQLTLYMEDLHGVKLPASSLSDGTLRFLALAVLEMDPEETGVLCLEEPENGIHPQRIAAMLRLLRDIAVDPGLSAGPDNPLRQVIVNTHSPVVVGQIASDHLLFADSAATAATGASAMRLRSLEKTWRAPRPGGPVPTISTGDILSYLGSPQISRHPIRIAKDSAPSVAAYLNEQMQQLHLFDSAGEQPDFAPKH